MLPIKEELEKRWLLFQNSSEDIFKLIDNWKANFYCWFDPTADSLHLWNFIGFMVAIHLMKRWNKYTALTWWATGMIWDPGWKDAERNFLSEEDLDNNQQKITTQMTSMLKNLESFTWFEFSYDFANNKDFYTWMWYLDFLREVWKYITVNVMMSKDTVKKRIEDPSKSISYTEFSYMLLQWYDFCRLFTDRNVNLQIWWQDQWWNLVTWTELIRKKYSKDTYCLTWPLITDSTWRKFWKSEWNAMFLDKSKTSPYEIYQYFMNTSDDDIEKYMKMLTLIDLDEINNIVADHNRTPEKREWQKILSYKIVEIIHWENEAKIAKDISDFMFTWVDRVEVLAWLNKHEIETFYNAIWWFTYSEENLFETIVKSWLANSNSEARQALNSWAIHINEEKISDPRHEFRDNFINDKVLLIRKWKKNFKIILK